MTHIQTQTVQIETLESNQRGIRDPFHLEGVDGVTNDSNMEKKQAAGEGVADLVVDRADPPPPRPVAPPTRRKTEEEEDRAHGARQEKQQCRLSPDPNWGNGDEA